MFYETAFSFPYHAYHQRENKEKKEDQSQWEPSVHVRPYEEKERKDHNLFFPQSSFRSIKKEHKNGKEKKSEELGPEEKIAIACRNP